MTGTGFSKASVLLRLAAAAAGIVVGVASCAPRTGEEGQGAEQSERVSVIMVTHGQAADPFWSTVKNGAESAAKDLNVDLSYEAPERGDPVEMARLIDGAVARNPDGIAVSIPDVDALRGPITEAINEGIPVVSLNSGGDVAESLGVLAHVGQEEELAGERGGERMADAGVKHALCVTHEQGNTALDLRCQGFEKTMTKAGAKVTGLAVDGTDASDAKRRIQGALSEDSSIDGIFTLGPLGFDPALSAIGDKDIQLATFDLSPEVLQAVRDGDALFAIDQQQFLQGYLPVEILAQNARFGLHPTGTVLTGPNFVTEENAQQVIDLAKRGIR